MIEANNLRKHFGRVPAVRDVSLRAADGRITGLLGPNGAGKSTTLRILYTVIAPEVGDAFIDGVSVVSQPLEARRHMGVLPHNAGIYPHLSGRENIAYFGALHGLSRDERRSRTV
ncbi:MAG TPA: ATP-binding cassette domain-containing protein, partial [Steroidobacteraceae bacterium]|nr:ATP-binding cassette domain-containing protein [Steroidobacteraceae bacterium]